MNIVTQNPGAARKLNKNMSAQHILKLVKRKNKEYCLL